MVKSFTVGVKHHVNLGNYESMEIEAQITLDIEDMGYVEARTEAQEALGTILNDTFQAQRKPPWFAEIASKKVRAS